MRGGDAGIRVVDREHASDALTTHLPALSPQGTEFGLFSCRNLEDLAFWPNEATEVNSIFKYLSYDCALLRLAERAFIPSRPAAEAEQMACRPRWIST
jgi:hypothetical protein